MTLEAEFRMVLARIGFNAAMVAHFAAEEGFEEIGALAISDDAIGNLLRHITRNQAAIPQLAAVRGV